MPNVAALHATDPRHIGRYRLTGRIVGLPAEGPVFLGAMANGTQVTVTLLDQSWIETGAARDRFTAEARAARRVPPFCAARILDSGVNEGRAYLVREYVPGPSLAELISREGPRSGGSLIALATGMATGLAAIHQAGLVHGQFGPQHVVLGPGGPRVGGFGITPPYGAATPAADMLSWARTVWYAAAGRAPGPGPLTPADLAAWPDPLRSLVARCGAADPAARPSAQAVVAELAGLDDPGADLLAEGSRRAVSAAFRPPAELPEQRRTRRLSPSGAIWWAMGIAVCVVAIAIAVHVLQDQGTRPAAATGPASGGQPGHGGGPGAGATPSAAPTSGGLVPGALAGTWLGHARQQGDRFEVSVQLTKGAPTGSIDYSGGSFSCSGVLDVEAATSGTLTTRQQITVGKGTCANGTVTLATASSGSLTFRFIGAAGPAAAGTLAKHG
jgi:hypothetical protein